MADKLPTTDPVVFRIPNGSGGTDEIVIDACVTEQHTLANTLTDHPVEEGSNITDHSRPEPRRVTLDCVQSNTPPPGRSDFATRRTQGTAKVTDDYAHQLWNRLVDLHDNPKLLSLDTARDFYDSMAIESVTSPVDVKTANVLKFTVSLKQIRTVTNTFTQIKPTKKPNQQGKKDAGKVTTEKLNIDQEQAPNEKLFDSFGSHL